MDKLYPIVRRVRRPLLPPDHELVSREEAKVAKGTEVSVTALRAEEEMDRPAEEVSGETPDTTGGTPVLPEDKE